MAIGGQIYVKFVAGDIYETRKNPNLVKIEKNRSFYLKTKVRLVVEDDIKLP
jgi:hypothetical protein